MKKKAFTLVEIIIVTLIIGILIVAAMALIKIRSNQYAAPYYTAYSSLKKAAYNVLADMYQTPPREFPTTTKELCERLTEFINISQTSTELATSCANADINTDAANISDSTIRFIGSNSFRYYISKQPNITVGGKTIQWFVVYVDLNGEKKPNSAAVLLNPSGKVKNPLPDIVPFAVTTRGEVIPMGYPTKSAYYMTAKVKYPNAYDGTKWVQNRYSPSTTYFDARGKAWGSVQNIGIIETIDFTSKLSASNVIRVAYNNEPPSSLPAIHAECVAGDYTCRVVVDSLVGRRF